MIRSFRNAFVAGLILLAPLGVTFVVVRFLMDNVGAPASNVFFGFLDAELRNQAWITTIVNLVSLFVVLVLVTLLGYLSNYVVGKIAFGMAEKGINRLPFINTVYNTVKQIVETFSKQQKAVFQKTVLVEYPRKGAYALGFLTGDAKGEVQNKTGAEVVNIFVPTTPNPTSGFLLMIPADEVIPLEMTISDGMKLIISGGAVVPPFPYPTPVSTSVGEHAATGKAIPLSNPSEAETREHPRA